MGFGTTLLNALTGGLVKDVGEAIDRNVTSDEERLQLHNDLVKIEAAASEKAQEFEKAIEENVTKRHEADMQSDSWLAKNVRPIVLISLTIVTITYLFAGLFINFGTVKADINPKVIVYQAGLGALIGLDMVVYGFYFGSRGVEKIAVRIAELFKGVKNVT